MSERQKILIIDDTEMNRLLLEEILSVEGYETIAARDGMEAMSLVNENYVDIILLDVMMPRMDGLEFCRRLRMNPRLRSIPVVMLTAMSQKEDRIRGIEAGADDYISKPFEARELITRVRSLLAGRRFNVRIERAYNSFADFITYTELCLSAFKPLEYSDVSVFEGLADLFIRKCIRETEKPSHFLIESRRRGLLYHFDNGKLTCEPIGHIDLAWVDSDGYLYNEGEHIQDAIAQHFSEVAGKIGPVRNLVVVSFDGFGMAALNYLRKVDRMDVQLMKGFAIHNKFFESLSNHAVEAENAFIYTINALARAAEANDEDTGNHIVRVSEYAKALAMEMGMPDSFVEAIGYSAQMHDVGKIHVPFEILKKPGVLTDKEFEVMKSHTVYGARILGDAPRLAMSSSIALTHHEKFDGSGYPYGLKGDDIPIEGRIVAVADLYDALRQQRIYKDSYYHDEAVRMILEGNDKTTPQQFDPDVLDAFKNVSGHFKETYTRYGS